MSLYASLLLTISVISAVPAVYLANHYLKKKQKITLLLIAFFALSSLFYFGYYLDIITVVPIENVMVIPFFALTIFGILLLIAIVMLGIREIYLLPPFIVAVALIHIYVVDSARTMMIIILQYVSYVVTGNLVGEPWMIALKALSPVFVSLTNSDPYLGILSKILDPLSAIIPQVYIPVLAFYLSVISTPAIIVFLFLAWKNRSGRSLGFALGIIAVDISSLLGTNQMTHAIIMVAATVLFALGIFGVLDKLIPKKEKSQETSAKTET
ncbi:MAG: hypothetical protein KIH08_09730 [Candidatus Freyarchaeota archaeon]|nr:hypothetical protein [Candidatus Jordarchaeia archaeon]MBS7268694.1 hypothetical protein [Candidatus Jordarchaeia archaeon]MBS7279756.1 hypothetical protein [Candidatus Jordarchaeia archaeon]